MAGKLINMHVIKQIIRFSQQGVFFTLENKFTHDAYGRMKSSEYPSGFKIYNAYNVNGYLKNIKGNNKTLWKCLAMNSLGQITSYKQGS